MAEIKLESLSKVFGSFAAVRELTLTVADGSFFVVLGPSGCGKTTTLRMIAGLELPSSGRILLDGDDVSGRRAAARDIAFVFQLFALYPHMNVRRNIGFPLRCQNLPRAAVRGRVEETARLLRIDHLLDRRVGGLSGGDRQRVALGRAIVRTPKAFLMLPRGFMPRQGSVKSSRPAASPSWGMVSSTIIFSTNSRRTYGA